MPVPFNIQSSRNYEQVNCAIVYIWICGTDRIHQFLTVRTCVVKREKILQVSRIPSNNPVFYSCFLRTKTGIE